MNVLTRRRCGRMVAAGLFVLAGATASAQVGSPCPPAPCAPPAVPGLAPGATPDLTAPPSTNTQVPPAADAGSGLGAENAGLALGGGAVAMQGDFVGGGVVAGPIPAVLRPLVRHNPDELCNCITGPVGAANANLVSRVPIVARGAFKITENESPRPVDRFYINYNYFTAVNQNFGAPGVPRLNLHQQIVGLEKTFFDGNMSIGARVPFIQPENTEYLGDSQVGDVTLILKSILLQQQGGPGLISGGVAVTVPSGRGQVSTVTGEEIHPTLLQPFVGYYLGPDRAFVQGFTSVVVPTDDRDVTILFNDIGVGYFVYQNPAATLAAIVPTAELHINTPLNHRGSRTDPVGFADVVNVTGGVHFLFQRATLALGVSTPVTGPQPFDLQALVQLNIRFGPSATGPRPSTFTPIGPIGG